MPSSAGLDVYPILSTLDSACWTNACMARCACRASCAGLVCELNLAANEGVCILCCACSSVHSGMNLLHWAVYVGW
jgi:hypothetical protein